MIENIAAWTEKTHPETGCVQFISVNRHGEYNQLVQITARQQDNQMTLITMSKEEFALFLLEAARKL